MLHKLPPQLLETVLLLHYRNQPSLHMRTFHSTDTTRPKEDFSRRASGIVFYAQKRRRVSDAKLRSFLRPVCEVSRVTVSISKDDVCFSVYFNGLGTVSLRLGADKFSTYCCFDELVLDVASSDCYRVV